MEGGARFEEFMRRNIRVFFQERKLEERQRRSAVKITTTGVVLDLLRLISRP